MDRGGGGTGIEGAESGVEGAGSGSRGGGKTYGTLTDIQVAAVR